MTSLVHKAWKIKIGLLFHLHLCLFKTARLGFKEQRGGLCGVDYK